MTEFGSNKYVIIDYISNLFKYGKKKMTITMVMQKILQ